ncbi:DNA mismatch repair protein MutH [Prevotella communis]|uniref:DNA mismatch repair protein MutH n=1 Tax=Prevotella communis TaxID=2913614 RepID=A0A1G8CDG6_9BACT|nr:MutH/Sau3AI family endonuclease [Prevotella communis]SDH43418.1 DNA mismatch repair protein MutH [Prevotella communis]
MISSKVIEYMRPLFDIISNSKGKTIGEIKDELNIERSKMVKGASGLIVENLLGIENNNRDEADIPEIGCEIKILPLQKNCDGSIKAKEPTAIQMINYMEVAKETWETAKLRGKIALTFWVVYLAKKDGKALSQNDYVIVDYFLDHPSDFQNGVFKTDWEEIQSYIKEGRADELSCSMGVYLEPKTKGANNQDKTDAPDGKGGITRARRRAFYYKKNYTNTAIIPNLDLSSIKNK